MTYYAVDGYDIFSLRDQLLAEISRNQDEGEWLALVDTAFDYEGKALNWFNDDIWPIYHQGKLEHMGSVSPCLLALTTTDKARLGKELIRLLQHCQGRPMLSFLRSKFEPVQLREHWQSLLEIETEDSQSFVLRFADTRVLPVLAEVSKIWTGLANGLAEWRFIERDGSLKTLGVPPAHIKEDTKIRISDEALSKLLKSGEADALACALDEHFPELLPAGKGAEVHARLVLQASMAENYGLVGTTNLFALAVADFSTECCLLEHVKFSSWLSQHPWQTMALEDALGDFLENHIMERAKT